MRLIDREAAKAELLRVMGEVQADGAYFDGIRDGYQSAADRLDTQPVVEARKHGRWKVEPYLIGTTHRCSMCGENYGMLHEIYKYCPYCGAKMDGE